MLPGQNGTGLTFRDFNIEMGRSPTAPLNINDPELRRLAATGRSGQSESAGTPFQVVNLFNRARIKLAINSNRNDVELYWLEQATGNYSFGKTYTTANVASGVAVSQSSLAFAAAVVINGNDGDILELNNNGGTISGVGGPGGRGNGGSGYNDGWAVGGYNGYAGGDAIVVNNPLQAIYLRNTGNIWGGGGGGAGGDGSNSGGKKRSPRAGGGGGGGAGGAGGAGGPGGICGGGTAIPGQPGQNGSLNAGGAGGGGGSPGGPGGNGGNPGSWGISRSQLGGGAPGFYIRNGGGAVTWLATGNRAGQAS